MKSVLTKPLFSFRLSALRKNSITLILIFLLTGECFTGFAQLSNDPESLVVHEKAILMGTIQSLSSDKNVIVPVMRNTDTELGNIQEFIRTYKKLNRIEKEKANKSLYYFINDLNKQVEQKKIHAFELTDVIKSFHLLLSAILHRKPVLPVLRPINKKFTGLLASSLTQYKEYAIIEDVATYNRVSSTPEFILRFLETKPNFRFADSLLLDAIKNDPVSVLYYLRKEGSPLKQRFLNVQDNSIRQFVALAKEKNATELAVFAPQMQKGTISAEEILRTREEPTKYFQLLVNSLLESRNTMTNHFMHNGIREKALAFYVNQVNDLHNASDAVRFASVKDLRPQDLYFIITTSGEELYTSSYLGLYKRLMSSFDQKNVDSLFELVNWQSFDVFIRLAANYNVLEDFFQRLSSEKLQEVLQMFVGYIDSDPSTAVEKAMDIADSFSNLRSSPKTLDLFQAEIESNLERVKSKQKLLGIRLYTILHNLLTLTRTEGGVEKIWRTLGDYETLTQTAVRDPKGNIAEVVLFYGDEDGVASFSNFMKNYSDKSAWQVKTNGDWVHIQSATNEAVSIYANRPLDMESKADLAAQEQLFTHLSSNGIQPSILVHRGHSYHLDKTLKRLSPSVKLAILGSCGGYNKSISIATMNPDIQVIGSRKMGAKAINDPMLNSINETLSSGANIHWPEIWNRLTARFKKDAGMLATFQEYFPPSHNLSLFVLKLYHSNKSLAGY